MDRNTSMNIPYPHKHYINTDIHPIAWQSVSSQWHTQTCVYSNVICKYHKCIYLLHKLSLSIDIWEGFFQLWQSKCIWVSWLLILKLFQWIEAKHYIHIKYPLFKSLDHSCSNLFNFMLGGSQFVSNFK